MNIFIRLNNLVKNLRRLSELEQSVAINSPFVDKAMEEKLKQPIKMAEIIKRRDPIKEALAEQT